MGLPSEEDAKPKDPEFDTAVIPRGDVVCTRCIMDTTCPGITFDQDGVCNFCHLHDKLDKMFPQGDAGQKELDKMFAQIRKDGEGKKYDSVFGISGGRDSIYSLWLAKKVWGLNPIAVHFNDGFGNPVAGKNMQKATQKLGVDMVTITSDWRESKDLRLSFLQASTPDTEEATDVGIAAALFGVAAKEGIKHIVIGQSFRTEGICPLSWNYLDGKYLVNVHKQFGKVPLRKWKPDDPGFNLQFKHLFYYCVLKGIKTHTPFYYMDYNRDQATELISKELDWENTGAHYYDDLYQALMTYVYRVKFNADRRKFNYSAMVRTGQMTRDEAWERTGSLYVIEDHKVINLCIKRLGITREKFDEYVALPPKTFRDYPTSYNMMRWLRFPIWILAKLRLIPEVAYDKYFNCGE